MPVVRVAGAITSIMTGHAYRTSARIAEVMGAFEGYEPTPTRCSG